MSSSTEDRAPAGAGLDGERVEAEGASGQRPQPHSSTVTPSGIEIDYFVADKDKGIKRHYEVRKPDSTRWKEWVEVPSISTVADVIKDPGPLIWWGMGVGISGVLEEYRRGVLRPSRTQDGQAVLACPGRLGDGKAGLVVAGLEQVLELLKIHDLTTNDVTGAAGDRGQSAHDALELWAQDGTIPEPSAFSPEEQGYIAGLRMFLQHLEDCEPEVVASERMVASVEHGFAGRFDLEIRTHKPGPIVHRWMPKRGPQVSTLEPGLYVPDLKTSKSVYETHFVQLEGYELGRVESGYEPSDARGIIHVHPGDPKDKRQPDTPYYEFVPSKRPEAARNVFLAALALLNAQEEL